MSIDFTSFAYMPILLAIAWGVVIYTIADGVVAYLQRRKQKDFLLDFQDDNEQLEEIKIGSGNYKIRVTFEALSIDVAGHEQKAIWISSLLLGSLFGLGLSVALSGLMAILIGLGAGYLLVQNFIQSQWNKAQVELEKEIPTLMRNLAGILQTEVNPTSAIQEAAEALRPEGHLKAWISYFLDEIHAHGMTESLPRLQEEANEINTSLSLLIFELGRMSSTGGSGYATAFRAAADNLALLTEVRAEAHSEAKSALGLAKLIIGVALGIYVFLYFNPAGRILYSAPNVPKWLAASAVLGIGGWFMIRRMVNKAVQ